MKELWVEKYRPKTLNDYVFADQEQHDMVASWIKSKFVPHLLLSGGSGTGKTTMAKMLINELGVDDYDVMYANGSKEGRKIEWVDVLINFVQTMPFGDYKIVLIDEADYMNLHSTQPALRNLMEDYGDHVRFILTCNYPNKIMPAIHSRCQTMHIAKTDKTEFTARAATVLVTEGVEFDLELLDVYVDSAYPDLRKCLNLLQQNSTTGKLAEPRSAEGGVHDWRMDAVQLFKNGNFRKAREVVCAQTQPDEAEDVFRWMYDNVDIFGATPEQQDEAVKIIAKGLVNHAMIADPEINLSSTFIELSQIA